MYEDKILVRSSAVLKARAFQDGWAASDVNSGYYGILGTVAIPEFNPQPGNFSDPIEVEITCGTEDASIYFTLDNNEPTESSMAYTQKIIIDTTTTIQAIAFKVDCTPSPVASGVFRILSVSEPDAPLIAHSPATIATYNHTQKINAAISNIIEDDRVFLYYRQGGAFVFDSTQMTENTSRIYEGSVPAGYLKERGIEYTFRIFRSDSLFRYQDTLFIQVNFAGLNNPIALPDTSYRMISVPVNLNSKDAASVLADNLGSHDRTQWRLLRKKSGGFTEYGVDNNFDLFDPGNGFWIISKTAKSWDVGAGISVSSASSVTVTLQPGWNQIGNPFAFPVSWSDVSADGDVEAPVGYEGLGNAISGYLYQQTELTPWKGYYVKNLSSQNVTLEIPPIAHEGSAAKAALPAVVSSLEEKEWLLRIHAASEKAVDPGNWIGFRESASNEWDLNDFSEVPPFGTFLSLYFDHEDWEKYPGLYTGDFRMDDFTWTFIVKSSSAQSEIRLSLGASYQLPDDFDVHLVDLQTGTITDLIVEQDYVFLSGKTESERKFELFVGSELNDQDLLQVVEILPISFKLYPNFPNPFNPETQILYDIPEQCQVSIEVYDLIGNRIRTLVNGTKNQGRHTVTWFGRDQNESQVATGVYLLRMQADSFTAVQKMVFVK